jgi:protein involved in sex pheromone biosynthesis
MKKMIRIDLDGPYYPKPTFYQRAWNWLVVLLLAAVFVFCLSGCSTTSTTSGKQDLVLDKSIQPMSRNEVVSAIGDCQANGLRAVLMYGKRKVNGYTADVVIDVTCAPKW